MFKLSLWSCLALSDIISYNSFKQQPQQKPVILCESAQLVELSENILATEFSKYCFLLKILLCRNELEFVSLTSYHCSHVNRKTNVRWRPTKASTACAVNWGRLHLHRSSMRNGVFSERQTKVIHVVQPQKQRKTKQNHPA